MVCGPDASMTGYVSIQNLHREGESGRGDVLASLLRQYSEQAKAGRLEGSAWNAAGNEVYADRRSRLKVRRRSRITVESEVRRVTTT